MEIEPTGQSTPSEPAPTPSEADSATPATMKKPAKVRLRLSKVKNTTPSGELPNRSIYLAISHDSPCQSQKMMPNRGSRRMRMAEGMAQLLQNLSLREKGKMRLILLMGQRQMSRLHPRVLSIVQPHLHARLL